MFRTPAIGILGLVIASAIGCADAGQDGDTDGGESEGEGEGEGTAGDEDASGSGSVSSSDGGSDDGDTLRLEIVGLPPVIAPAVTWPAFSVEVRRSGAPVADADVTSVTLSVRDGTGTLAGTTSRPVDGGVASFSDLVYDVCEPITVRAAPEPAGLAPVDATLTVAPRIRLLESGPAAQPPGVLAPIVVQTIDHGDTPLALSGLTVDVTVEAGSVALAPGSVTQATIADGQATFDALEVDAVGELRLRFVATDPAHPDCTIPAATATIVVGGTLGFQPVFLEGARVGVAYDDAAPAVAEATHTVRSGELPPGLALDPNGSIAGTPTTAGVYEFELLRSVAGTPTDRLRVQLPVFAAGDAGTTAAEDPAAPGAYDVATTTLYAGPLTVTSGTWNDVAVLVHYPAAPGGGGVADGRFPVIAFHHAAHSPTDIYDDYTALHSHWASQGFVVASIDSTRNLAPAPNEWIPQSWTNLSDMSTFQRAAADLMLAENDDPASPFHQHVDADRIVVSGHSRGGGASLISLSEDPRLFGAICFEQVSPAQTPGQDFGSDENFDRWLPTKPILILSASGDRDEPWPFVDLSYEQRTGPTTLVTIHDTNHEWTYDEDTPGSLTSASGISASERHEIDQFYSTAFLRRFVGADMGFDGIVFASEGESTDLSGPGVSVHSDRHMNTMVLVDDFVGADSTTNALGEPVSGSGLAVDENAETYADGLVEHDITDERRTRIAARARARRIEWVQAGAWMSYLAEGGGLDLSERELLRFRVARACDPPPTEAGLPDDTCPDATVDFEVIVVDASGGSATLPVADLVGDRGVLGRHWANATVRLDALAGVDASALQRIELSTGSAAGRIWIDDLRLE